MIQNFLNRAGLDYMAEQFQVNKITGKVLMLLTEVSNWLTCSDIDQ